MKNEDKVGQKSLEREQNKTEKFEKEDKIGQKSEYFIKLKIYVVVGNWL